jgi:hypothetical protein
LYVMNSPLCLKKQEFYAFSYKKWKRPFSDF